MRHKNKRPPADKLRGRLFVTDRCRDSSRRLHRAQNDTNKVRRMAGEHSSPLRVLHFLCRGRPPGRPENESRKALGARGRGMHRGWRRMATKKASPMRGSSRAAGDEVSSHKCFFHLIRRLRRHLPLSGEGFGSARTWNASRIAGLSIVLACGEHVDMPLRGNCGTSAPTGERVAREFIPNKRGCHSEEGNSPTKNLAGESLRSVLRCRDSSRRLHRAQNDTERCAICTAPKMGHRSRE